MFRYECERSDREDWLSGYPVPYISVFGIELREAGVIPWGWGIAWREYHRDVYILLPIPLNIIVKWAREFYFWLMRGGRS